MINFEVVENTEKSITIALDSTDTTLINPILDVLNKNENVKLARYMVIHPELEEPRLIVEVYDNSSISAKEALVNAANFVAEYFSEINKNISDWYVPHNISHSSHENLFLDEKTIKSSYDKKNIEKEGYPAKGE